MDNSPTSLFESYEQDFVQAIASVREKLDADGPGMRGEERKASLRRVELELDEADEMVAFLRLKVDLNLMKRCIGVSNIR